MTDEKLEALLISQGGKNTPEGWEFSESLNLSSKGLTKLPKIKSVGGNFFCYDNSLTSLVGCPQIIGGSFSCSNNPINSLEYCPQTVGGGFYCDNNSLTSLVGCPQTVGGDILCQKNNLTSEFFTHGHIFQGNGVFFMVLKYDKKNGVISLRSISHDEKIVKVYI